MAQNLNVKRVKDIGRRDASVLSNGLLQAMIDDWGGMVPELSLSRDAGRINAHWQPAFRSNSGGDFDADDGFWPVELLYHVAGNFPCLPNFGPPNEALGVEHPAHGITANALWEVVDSGVLDNRAVYLKSRLDGGRNGSFPIVYTKYDVLISRQPVHYTVMTVENRGDRDLSINAGWHNTVGSPFLSAGCLIDTCAKTFATAPSPSEFDDTGRLAIGAQFDDFSAAPLKAGGITDLRRVPGLIGYSDLATGAVPVGAAVGWSSVTNPVLGAVYLTAYKGAGRAGDNDITLNFADFWFQYGGRRFPPWAAYEGGTDTTFCIGTENASGAFANGLSFALDNRELLGRPTTVQLAAGGEKRLVYGTALFAYGDGTLDAGVEGVEWTDTGLAVKGHGGTSWEIGAEPNFAGIEDIVSEIG